MGAGQRITGEKIWLDGRFVDWDDAHVHILTHTLHYGLGVFEGIRCYRTADDRSAVFRLGDHVRRLYDSAHINLIEVPFPAEQVEEAVLETLRRNHLDQGYIRPLIFIGDGEMGLNPGSNPIRTAIVAWPWGKYLGEEGLERGIRAKVSTFSRNFVNAKMTKGKTCGDYVNSILGSWRSARRCWTATTRRSSWIPRASSPRPAGRTSSWCREACCTRRRSRRCWVGSRDRP
jgi:branched-chain amino acid aminotransferase